MAQKSSLEKAKILTKKMKQGRTKKKLAELKKQQELGEEEYQKLVLRRRTKSLAERVAVSIWDWEHKQYPMNKRNYLEEMLKERLLEINEPQNFQETRERDKIEVILNELSN